MHSLRRLLLANVEVPYQLGRSPIVTNALIFFLMMVAFLVVSLVPKTNSAQKLMLLLAHHPQLRHVHMEVVHPVLHLTTSMAAICKTEVV